MRKLIHQNRVRSWEAMGGACFFVAGIVAPLLGSLLTASGWIFGADVHPWLHAAGTALFVIAIPLILVAGVCLDWAEREQEKPLHDREEVQEGLKTWQQRSSGY